VIVSCCWLQELLGAVELDGVLLLEAPADGLVDAEALADGPVVAPMAGISVGRPPPPLGEELGDGLVELLADGLALAELDGVALPDGRGEVVLDGDAEPGPLVGHGLLLALLLGDTLGLAPEVIV
jgi:hypothetical protein